MTRHAPTAGPATTRLLDARVRLGPEAERLDTAGEPPLWRNETLGGASLWVAGGYDAVREVLTDRRLRRDVRVSGPWAARLPTERPPAGPGTHRNMFLADGPDHARLRHAGTRALTRGRVARTAAILPGIAASLLDGCAARGRADLIGEFAFPLAVAATCELLGIPAEFAREYLTFPRWESDALSRSPRRAVLAAYHRDVRKRYLWTVRLIAHKRRHPDADPLTEMIAARDAGEIDEGELTSAILVLMVAGYDSFLGFVGMSLLALWHRPELLADPAAVPDGVDELLRYTAPQAALFPRFVTEPMTLHGIDMAPGDAVMAHLPLALRDPSRFAEPHRLDLTRRPTRDLTFGRGPRACPGTDLARLEARAALAALMNRLPRITPAAPLDRLAWRPGSTGPIDQLHVVTGLKSLPVVFRPSPETPRSR